MLANRNQSVINHTGRDSRKYFYLHLSSALSYKLKKHCNYATFSFRYNTLDKAISDYNDTIKELDRKNADINRLDRKFIDVTPFYLKVSV